MTTAQQLIDKVAIGIDDKLAQMEAARQLGINAANALSPRLNLIEGVANRKTVYINETVAESGNGLSTATPFKTWADFLTWFNSNAGQSQTNIILMSDVNVDKRGFATTPPSSLGIFAYGGGNFKLVIKDATNTNDPGGLQMQEAMGLDIRVPVHLDSTRAGGFFHSNKAGAFGLLSQNLTLTESGQNQASLIDRGFAGAVWSLEISAHDLSGAPGRLFRYLAAGTNPRTDTSAWFITASNVTSI